MGGTGYAAVRLPTGSVGAKQLKKNSVSSAKVKNRSLLLNDFKRAERTKLRGANGAQGYAGWSDSEASRDFAAVRARPALRARTGRRAWTERPEWMEPQARMEQRAWSRWWCGLRH
jgi:hypothetical protein